MAELVKCRDCGQKVSPRAASCPKCGGPIKRKSSGCASVIATLIALGVVGGVVSTCNESTSAKRTSTTKPTTKPTPAPSSTRGAQAPHSNREPERKRHLVALPSFNRPSEPDWEARRAHWEQYYDERAKEPVIGNNITLRLSSGATQSGRLAELTEDSVTLARGSVNITLQRSRLAAGSQRQLWPAAFRSLYADRQLENERKEYGARLADAFDAHIQKVEMLSAEWYARNNSYEKQISGEVSQVIGNDALLYRKGYDEPVYVVGIGSSVVDGSQWSGTVYSAGTVEYTTVLGAPKKVIKYTVYPSAEAAQTAIKKNYVDEELRKLRSQKYTEVASYTD